MFLDSRLANTPQWWMTKPGDYQMRIPEVFRKCVVFLGRVLPDGNPRFGGTGFFVTVKHSEHRFCYLVTAQHVANRLSLGEWCIRFNMKNGRFVDAKVNKDQKWWFHHTEKNSVDVAVTDLRPPDEGDCSALPESMFLDDDRMKEHGISGGDEVFITGLFTKAKGELRNIPIVRTGNVALIPDPGELVPNVKMNGHVADAEVYLIEARSIGGLSGSPVFVRATIADKRMVKLASGKEEEMVCTFSGSFSLFGLAQGHWSVMPEDKNEANPCTSPKDDEKVNLGIAVVVPAKKILEVLCHPELIAIRESWRGDELSLPF